MPDFLSVLTLTGPPRLGGVLMPYCTATSALTPEWRAEHIVKTMAGGLQKVKQRRYRARFRLGWKGLTAEQFETLVGVLEEKTFEFVPRTAATGEPLIFVGEGGAVFSTETAYTVRCVSSVPFDTPRRVSHATYDLDAEIESVSVVSDPTAISDGSPAPGTGTAPTNTPGYSSAGAIEIVCPDAVLFFETDPSYSLHLQDPADVVLSADADGVARFTKRLQDLYGYRFDVTDISVTTGSPALDATPAGAFKWVVCPIECIETESETGAYSVRDVEFYILYAFIASGTYTVTITASYECEGLETVLSFEITKP